MNFLDTGTYTTYWANTSSNRLDKVESGREACYELALTNGEVRIMFEGMVKDWFRRTKPAYSGFIKAMLLGDLDAMNEYMNQITCEIFSNFDTGKRVSTKAQPERFYHGFVLGLMVDLQADYIISSNRESGFGRYDMKLLSRGIPKNRIYKYGFAFEGKTVLIDTLPKGRMRGENHNQTTTF